MPCGKESTIKKPFWKTWKVPKDLPRGPSKGLFRDFRFHNHSYTVFLLEYASISDYIGVMKRTIMLVCMLLTSEAAYSNMGRCESTMHTVVSKIHKWQTEKRLQYAKLYGWNSGARVLRRMLRNNPEPSLQIQIAKAASKVNPSRAIEILKELARNKDPSPELQEAIAFSMIEILHIVRNWTTGEQEKAMQFLEEWFKNKELHSKKLQNIFIYAAVTIGGKTGFEFLEKISEKYPSLKVEQQFAQIAAYTGGPKGEDMFKKRITARDLSPQEQEIYAFYAGQTREHYGLSVLKLLKQEGTLSPRELESIFSAGQAEARLKILEAQERERNRRRNF